VQRLIQSNKQTKKTSSSRIGLYCDGATLNPSKQTKHLPSSNIGLYFVGATFSLIKQNTKHLPPTLAFTLLGQRLSQSNKQTKLGDK
jgi:hypothetical protein